MKVKTADLIGPALDWAVATIEGYGGLRRNPHAFDQSLIMNRGDGQCVLFPSLKYSTDWSQGGPIIERERISVAHDDDGEWEACQRAQLQSMFGFNGDNYSTGPTPLIAVCRCFVASRLGDEVDVPDELV